MANQNLNIPQGPFIDPISNRPSIPWLYWLMNPNVNSINSTTGLSVTSGGTGLNTIPTNGQLLIGNGSGYTLNTLTQLSGISITNSSGSISIANSGVLSFTGGTTGLTPSSATTGAVTLSGTLNVSNGGSGATTLTGYLKGNGTSAFTAVSSIPYTDISGLGSIVTQNLGATGTFKSGDLPQKTITVTNGIITAIV